MNEKFRYLFENRHITSGVSQAIPIELQLFMWEEINQLTKQNQELDYLQVFEFKIKRNSLMIEHRQEQPNRRKYHYISLLEEYKALAGIKIFVIDEIEYCVMLLASEY